MLLREVNRVRKVAGRNQLSDEILPLRRRVIRPVEERVRQSPVPCRRTKHALRLLVGMAVSMVLVILRLRLVLGIAMFVT